MNINLSKEDEIKVLKKQRIVNKLCLFLSNIPAFYIIGNFFMTQCSLSGDTTTRLCNVYPYVESIVMPGIGNDSTIVIIIAMVISGVLAAPFIIRQVCIEKKIKELNKN